MGHEPALLRQHIQPDLPPIDLHTPEGQLAEGDLARDYPNTVLNWTIRLATRVEWIMSSV